jgi:UDP-N-acetylglucosamine diphosphorylase/glucosamine-1-phosphate N-acetyltransferase
MTLHICVYEDNKYSRFYPLTNLRPVYFLRAGMTPLYRRVRRYFPKPELSLACRHSLASVVGQTVRDLPVNIIRRPGNDGRLLLLNGRIRDFGDLPKMVREASNSTIFVNGEETIGIVLLGDLLSAVPELTTPLDLLNLIREKQDEIFDFHTTATLYNYLWDIMGDIEAEINADFEHYGVLTVPSDLAGIHERAFILNDEQVHVAAGAAVMPGAIIDASAGPVFIGANTKIEPHAAVYGPAFIAPNCVVLAGKVTGCSIGHTCRIGGEVEETVFQSFVNKYHDGFIGHSYVGQWVNFGAMTTNSDLKNNYSPIRCTLNGQSIDSGSIKVGSFIGDHTKFGIGTLLNTGINIGICCNIFGGTLITDKEVPPFRWGYSGKYDTYDIEKAIETARIVAGRRQETLSEAEETLMRAVFEGRDETDGALSL